MSPVTGFRKKIDGLNPKCICGAMGQNHAAGGLLPSPAVVVVDAENGDARATLDRRWNAESVFPDGHPCFLSSPLSRKFA